MAVHQPQRDLATMSLTEDATLVLRIRTPNEPEREVALTGGKWTIGSGPRCNIRIQGQGVHPLHCLISGEAEGLVVRRWSPNTLLNGSTFTASSLAVGDRLQFGSIEVEVSDAEGASSSSPEWSAESEPPVASTSQPAYESTEVEATHFEPRKSHPPIEAPTPRIVESGHPSTEPVFPAGDLGPAGRGRQEVIAAAEAVFQQLRSANSIARGRGRKLLAAMRRERTSYRQLQHRLSALEQRTIEALREIENLSGRCSGLTHERDTLNDRLATAQQRLVEFQQKRDEKQQLCEELEAQLAEWQSQYAGLQDELNKAQAEFEDRQLSFEQEQSRWNEERQLLEGGLQDIQADQDTREAHWRQQLECIEQELNLARDDAKVLKHRLHQDHATWKKERESLEEKITQADAERGKLEAERSEWEQLIASLHEELDQGRAEVQRYESQLQVERVAWTEQHQTIQTHLAELQAERDRLEVERVRWEKSVASLQEEVSKARSEADRHEQRYQIDLSAWVKDRENLETDIRDISAQREALDAQRQELEHRISALQQEAGELRHHSQTFQQSAQAERAAWEQERQTLRDKFAEIQDERNSLEAQQDEWHRLRAELEARLADWQKKIAELERELEIQADEDRRNSGVFETEKSKWQQERQELEGRIETYERSQKEAASHARKSGAIEKENHRLAEELRQLTEGKDGLARELEAAQGQLRELQSQLSGQGSAAQSLAHRVEQLGEERQTILQERDQLAKDHHVLKAEIAQLRQTLTNQRAAWLERQSVLENELEQARSNVPSATTSVSVTPPPAEADSKSPPQDMPARKLGSVRPQSKPVAKESQPVSPPKTESRSPSFIERYSHLFEEEEAKAPTAPKKPEPSHTVFVSPTVPIPAAGPQSQAPAHGADDGSMEEYMSKLMQRLRGESSTPAAVYQPPVSSTEESESGAPFAGTAESDVAPTTSWAEKGAGESSTSETSDQDLQPRQRTAPERSADMSVLRALANTSARQAIATKVSKERGHHASVNLFMAVVAIGSGGYLVSTAPDILGFQFIGGVAALSTAIYWGFLALDRLMAAKKMRKIDEPKWGEDGLPIEKEENPIG